MKHIKISIKANEHQQEEYIALLDELGAQGFEQNDHELIAYFLNEEFPTEEIDIVLKNVQYSISELADQNWNEIWEQNFQPVVVNHFCAVRAHFHQPIKTVQHEIIITPKMSFGTGHHATTYMMIEQMQQLNFINKQVFDFGTGTGILAILARRLGAASVTAIDVDVWSIENANENVERNNGTGINLELSTKVPQASFDIILANINRNVILDYLPRLKQSLNKGGQLLISGLLASDEKDIVRAADEQQLNLIKQSGKTGWIALLFVNPS